MNYKLKVSTDVEEVYDYSNCTEEEKKAHKKAMESKGYELVFPCEENELRYSNEENYYKILDAIQRSCGKDEKDPLGIKMNFKENEFFEFRVFYYNGIYYVAYKDYTTYLYMGTLDDFLRSRDYKMEEIFEEYDYYKQILKKEHNIEAI